MKTTLLKKTSAIITFSILGPAFANANLFVYEGFNYGGSSMDINGVSVGGGALGLSGAYSTSTGTSGNGNVQASTYNPTGLEFSNIQTTGGSLYQNVSPTILQDKEYVYSHASFDTVATGTVYQSMLARVDSNNLANATLGKDPSNSGISDLRAQDTSDIIGNGNGYMSAQTKRPNQGGVKVGAYYSANGSISGSGSINLSEVYLFVSRYTNVGGAGGGEANMWVFNETSYDSWQANGGLESDMNTYALISTSNSSTDTITLSDSQSMRIATAEFSVDFNSGADNYDNTGEISTSYDEIRFGSSLGDVISTIPEPSQYSLIAGILFMSLAVLRRRK
ncbi:hypothetical protein [Puniceicoccus vermicola]|uniref:PEP-CTERM sorting domain-containing protein n=1 Tax=Puniceicoccus vermicola TaxID=388746 RepID=A0A7X1AZM8_9BACT|nr:hypothetical protein [Puniceicoccus vermicola]MBC2602849.1 hypothetical protein [Puniceicoccus vermicola]